MSDPRESVLFVDDDADVRKTAELLLKKRGYVFFGASDPQEAMSILVANAVDVVLLDLNFSKGQTSGEEGLACLKDILRFDPRAVVVVVTGHSGLNIAVQALRNGAHDFIMKPWNNDRLVEAIDKGTASRKAEQEEILDTSVMVGASDAIQRIKSTIDRCAPLTVSVLFRGETGTGKTLAALNLHRQSGRSNLRHLEASALSNGGLSDTQNTTIILENIERLPEPLSPALFTWLGRAQRQNSRLVTTTSQPGMDLGLDRGLTYAIRTVDIAVPSLRSRVDDIVPIAEHFMRVTCQQQGIAAKSLSPEARSLLVTHDWTDNVHALRHVIERSVILLDGKTIGAADLALESDTKTQAPAKPKLASSEKSMIEESLRRHNFNVSAAADELGLTRPSLYRRMSKHGL